MNPIAIGAILTAYVAIISLLIGVIQSTRLRAVVYSLPIPMSVLAILNPDLIDPNIIVGLLINASFFWLVASGDRWGWHRIPSTIIATAVYIGASWILKDIPGLSITIALGVTIVAWIFVFPWVKKIPPTQSSPTSQIGIKRLLIVFFTATGAVSISSIIGPYVVTFPFTAITMTLTYPGSVIPFARSFWVNGLLPLVAYGTGLVIGGELGYSAWVAVLMGIGMWLIATGITALVQRPSPNSTVSENQG
jgi:hypothetical protein